MAGESEAPAAAPRPDAAGSRAEPGRAWCPRPEPAATASAALADDAPPGIERAKRTAAAILIAEAGRTFGASLDLNETLHSIGDLIVGWFADWCIVDLIDVEGRLRRMSVAAADPAAADLARRLRDFEPAADGPSLVQDALRSRTTGVVDVVTDDHLRGISQSDEHLALLRSLGLASYVTVPLIAGGDLLGSIVIGRRRGRIAPDEVRLAREIAGLAAIAIQNARRYDGALRALGTRDDRLAVVAHDLRAPLSNVVFAAGLLRLRASQSGIEGLESLVEIIHRGADQMSRLIDDLTDAAGLASGRFSMAIGTVPAAAFVTDAVNAFAAAAASRGVTLSADLAPDIGELHVDRGRLLQALSNLIANAIKFTEPGGWIRLGVERLDGTVHFTVADSGCGIPAALQERVFEAFWRHDDGEQRGLGLGLAIVRSIVAAHGGRVWIESELGRGTTVHLVLPAS